MNLHQHIGRTGSQHTPFIFSCADYMRMGPVLGPEIEKTELLDGVIYQMPADGAVTRKWNSGMAEWLYKSKPDNIVAISHQTLPLGGNWAPSPDYYLFPADVTHEAVGGNDILLVIEVSDSTLKYDLGEKAKAYFDHGVAEYWVIDPNARAVHVHRRMPDAKHYKVTVLTAEEPIEAQAIPGLYLRLADLPRIN